VRLRSGEELKAQTLEQFLALTRKTLAAGD
jgi:hypothetical protein